MNRDEAVAILEREMGRYRRLSFAELLRLLDEVETREVISGGTNYQLEFQAVWDDEPRVHLRVFGMIDDGGWRSLSPLTSDFIIAPDGSFVGE